MSGVLARRRDGSFSAVLALRLPRTLLAASCARAAGHPRRRHTAAAVTWRFDRETAPASRLDRLEQALGLTPTCSMQQLQTHAQRGWLGHVLQLLCASEAWQPAAQGLCKLACSGNAPSRTSPEEPARAPRQRR